MILDTSKKKHLQKRKTLEQYTTNDIGYIKKKKKQAHYITQTTYITKTIHKTRTITHCVNQIRAFSNNILV